MRHKQTDASSAELFMSAQSQIESYFGLIDKVFSFQNASEPTEYIFSFIDIFLFDL